MCRRRDSNPRPSDYDSAPLFSGACGCSAFWPLIGRFWAIGRLSAFGGLWMLPCPPLAHLTDRPRFSSLIRSFVLHFSSGIHPSARKHGIADEDIEHAATNAISIDDQEGDTRLYLGPARNSDLLEVVTIVRDDGSELAIHAMRMRPKYRHLLAGGG